MSNYLPVTELTQQSNHMLTWRYRFSPIIDASDMLLDIDRLNTIHHLAGIIRSSVVDYQGEVSNYVAIPTGMDSNGVVKGAAAVKTRTTHVAETVNMPLHPDSTPAAYSRSMVVHQLNKAEIANRASSDSASSRDSREVVMARQLDRALRASFHTAARQNLLSKVRLSGVVGVAAYGFDVFQFTVPDLLTGISLDALGYATALTIQSVTNRKRDKASRLFSLSPSSQCMPDRFVVASALIKKPGLIKAAG